jgi:hypothetical protein
MSSVRHSYREEAENIAFEVGRLKGDRAALVEALEEVFVLIEERAADRAYERSRAHVCAVLDTHVEDEHRNEGRYP